MNRLHGAALTVLLLALGACASATAAGPEPAASRLETRVGALDEAVTSWAQARTLTEAKSGAEAARNLVTGPHVAGYGDADGDGQIAGDSTIGLLPGEQGQAGLVQSQASPCVEWDVLGGDWTDPAARWADAHARIDQWSSTNNTFPGLASHPQRVVGWASVTLDSTTLEAAREYAGHAATHVAVTRQAITTCSSSTPT